MALLSDPDRAAVHALFMRDSSRSRDLLPLLKADLLAAVDAIDAWADANKASFNAAIPLPARTVLTPAQKADLLLYVIRQRFVAGS